MSSCSWLLIPFSQVHFSGFILLQFVAFPKQCSWFIFRAVSSRSVFRVSLSDHKMCSCHEYWDEILQVQHPLAQRLLPEQLEPLTRLTSKLTLPFNTMVRFNALDYTKRDVFLSVHATLFLKSCIERSLLLSYNPLEMAVNIMQPDCEGLRLWAL